MASSPGGCLRYGWSVLLLVAVEALALVWVSTLDRAWPPITAISMVAALFCLAIGVVALFMQPSRITQLGGYMIVALAAFILVPVRPGMLFRPSAGPLHLILPTYALFRLINGALLATVAHHLAAHFPLHFAANHARQPSSRSIILSYLITALLVGALLVLPIPAAQITLLVTTMLWIYLLIGRATWRLARISRDPITANGLARQQARILLISALLATIPSIVLNGLELLMGAPVVRADFATFFLILFPVGTTYAILRHDLLTIDGAIRRALAYAALSMLALLVYFAVTLILTVGVVRHWPDLLRLVGAVSVLAVTLIFAPLQQRVQRWVDHWLYPERQQFFSALAQARQRLGMVVKEADVVALLTEQFPAAVGAQWAALKLLPASLTMPVQPTQLAFAAPLVVDQRLLGHYWLGPRQSFAIYEADEEGQLHDLLQEAALVLAYAATIAALRQLNDELEERVATRTAQIVIQQRALAAHEQREKLARDLHDSVTQSLFSLNLALRAIRKLGERDAQRALAELATQEEAAQQALGEMRALLTQLRSDSVEDTEEWATGEGERRELMGELAAHIAHLREQGQLQVTLAGQSELWLPTATVTEIFYIVREALHNVYKHSGQDRATVTVDRVGPTLTITVADRGRGFDGPVAHSAAPHFGLRGMQERAAKLGGQLTITSEPLRGTTVTLTINRLST